MEKIKTCSDYKIKNIVINPDNSFGCDVEGKHIIGTIIEIGKIKCVKYARNINSTKQTTLRIRMAIEFAIN